MSYSLMISMAAFIYACGSSAAEHMSMPAIPSLPVMEIRADSSKTYQEFPASLEGKVNVEIRSQVDGYLEKIYVDEGAYVTAGQPLFRINDRIYAEQYTNAQSGLLAANANMLKASIEVERLKPLVQENVIADVQLKSAQSAYAAAKAQVAQARSVVENARIILGYTLIKAPVTGYIGRIPFKTGSLVMRGGIEPLTILSDVTEVYAYFSMSEVDFIRFSNQHNGSTIEEKLKHVPAVELVMADNTLYERTGTIQIVEGQFDKTMGAITFRAKFPNAGRTIRTGNTGRVRIPQLYTAAMLVPQESTFEIQDKVFVFVVGDSNKVYSRPLSLAGKTEQHYIVNKGLEPGQKIVLSGIGSLRDGMVISPKQISTDDYKAKQKSSGSINE